MRRDTIVGLMEQVFFRFHVRLIDAMKRIGSKKTRQCVEYVVLVVAVLSLWLLIRLHRTFVISMDARPCLAELFESIGPFDLLRLEIKPKALYYYSRHKAYLMLPDELRGRHNITEKMIRVVRDSECFGPSGKVQEYIHYVLGYDTILCNNLIAEFHGSGYLYNQHNKELFNLNYAAEFQAATTSSSFQFWLYKLGVLCSTLFLFFTTTTLVSFTLRETQQRMLQFTYLLQYHIRNRLPYAGIVFSHVIESLVFVPIMVGMLFFLFEFFKDQLLAFFVLSIVWLCELFSVVSLRTRLAIMYYPRLFLCYFALFHIYFFSYPFGFSYSALLTTVLFLLHTMLYFWNHCEIPALEHRIVSFASPRQMS